MHLSRQKMKGQQTPAGALLVGAPLSPRNARILRNARTTKTLICTARALLSTFAAMIAPCSVKTYGQRRRPPCPELEVPIWYFKFCHSSAEI